MASLSKAEQILVNTLTIADLERGECSRFLPYATAAVRSDLSLSSFSSFIHNLESQLEVVLKNMELHPYLRQDDSEDRSSIDIVAGLKLLGIPASHGTNFGGGSTDISCLIHDQFLWIAEAKNDYNNSHILEGFRQLVDRYVMGSHRIQRKGALVIYCKNKPASAVLDSWKQYLTQINPEEYSVTVESSEESTFETTHYHRASNQRLYVKHIVVSLYQDHTDKSAKGRKPPKKIYCDNCHAEINGN